MDSPTTWIMLILLLLLIGVVVFWLLRRPGDDTGAALDARDEGGLIGSEGQDGVTPGADPATSGYGGADPATTPYAGADPATTEHGGTEPVEQAPGVTGEAPAGAAVGGTESHRPEAQEGELAGTEGEALAPTESRYDTAAPASGDEGTVADAGAGDETGEDDPDRWREAAAIGAVGAAGGAAAVAAQPDEDDARSDDVEVVEETAVVDEAPAEEVYVEETILVEEVPADQGDVEETTVVEETEGDQLYAGEASDEVVVEETVVEETPAEEAYVEQTPAEEAYVEQTPAEEAYVEQTPAEEVYVEETGDQAYDGASDGEVVDTTVVEETPDEVVVEETVVEETPGDEVYAGETLPDEVPADETPSGEEVAVGGVHALSDEEVNDGASDEPLSGGGQAPAGEPLTADEVLDAQEGQEEYPVGDSSTTYRADSGEAVAVETDDGVAPAAPEDDQPGRYAEPDRGGEGRWTEPAGTEAEPAQGGSWTDRGTATRTDPVVDDTPDQGWTEQGTAAGAADLAEQEDQTWTDQGTVTRDHEAAVEEHPAQGWTDEGTSAGAAPALDDEPAQGWTDEGTTTQEPAPAAAPAPGSAVEDQPAQGWTDEGTAAPAEPAAGGNDVEAPVFAESIYGAGSAEPLEDGSGPAGWAIKGNSGSMLFHTPESPSYDGVRAEVWFESEEAARAAGFAHWDRRQR